MNIKVLPLDRCMSIEILEEWEENWRSHWKEIPPVFNFPSKYLLGNKCWCEFDGKAFEYDEEQFRYELALAHASELNHLQVDALKAICSTNLATKKQRELLRLYGDHLGILDIYRSARK